MYLLFEMRGPHQGAARKIAQQMNCFSRYPLSIQSAVFVLLFGLLSSVNVLAQCDDVNGNSICDVNESGCTIELAGNCDPTAVFDGGACDFVSCLSIGCTDANACNFDAGATYDDGTCSYPAFPYDCDGACVNDTDSDGICDEFETP